MAGETAHFDLRKRVPTLAVRPIDSAPGIKAILERAHAALADHVAGIVYDNDMPSRENIHTAVRTPNGNDMARIYCASIMPSTTTRMPRRHLGSREIAASIVRKEILV